jgi:hypothetical protein
MSPLGLGGRHASRASNPTQLNCGMANVDAAHMFHFQPSLPSRCIVTILILVNYARALPGLRRSGQPSQYKTAAAKMKANRKNA